MADDSLTNLSLESKSLGTIFLAPRQFDMAAFSKASLLVFPYAMDQEQRMVAMEAAASTQVPMFCLARDINRLHRDGFGTYRFHRIEGFREVDFHGGSVEFYPSTRSHSPGIRGLATELLEAFGLLAPVGYHVLIQPRSEASFLFLSSPEMDAIEWKILARSNPQHVIGASTSSFDSWTNLAKVVGCNIGYERLSGPLRLKQVETPNTIDQSVDAWPGRSGLVLP